MCWEERVSVIYGVYKNRIGKNIYETDDESICVRYGVYSLG